MARLLSLLLAPLVSLAILPALAEAAPADPDANFGSAAIATADVHLTGAVPSDTPEFRAVAIQPDGAIVAVGSDWIARFDSDGSLDTDFADAGVLTLPAHIELTDVALRADGEIVAAGYWDTYRGTGVSSIGYDTVLVRAGADGTLDQSFDGNAEDGEGVASKPSGDGIVVIPLAPAFGDDSATSLVLDGDSILIGGAVDIDSRTSANPRAKMNLQGFVARVQADGSLDPDFGSGGEVQLSAAPDPDADTVTDIVQTSQGLVAKMVSATASPDRLVRIDPDTGALDSGFGTAGVATDSVATDARGLAETPDGGLITAGRWLGPCTVDPDSLQQPTCTESPDMDFEVTKFTQAGQLDTDFGNGGHAIVGFDQAGDPRAGLDVARSLTVQPDGRILVAGSTEVPGGSEGVYLHSIALARLNSDGSPDLGFSGDGRETGSIETYSDHPFLGGEDVALQSDGRIVVPGFTVRPGSDTADDLVPALFRFTGGAGAPVVTRLDAPHTQITSGPKVTRSRKATFRFLADMASTFHCRMDHHPMVSCKTSFSARGLALGRHTFEVYAVNSDGVRGPSAKRSFQVKKPRRSHSRGRLLQ